MLVATIALMPSYAYAQVKTDNDHDLLPSVSSTYVSKNGLVEITFPSGWKGAEIENGSVTTAITSNGGSGVSNTPDFSKPLIMLILSDGKNISDPGTSLISAASTGRLYCKPSEVQKAWINDAFGTLSMTSCSFGTDTSNSLLMKTLMVETISNWVMAAYVAPQAEFSQGLNAFDDTLRSFKVFNPLEPNLLRGHLASTYYDIHAAGANVTMEIASSSKVEGFSFDESNRIIHMNVNEMGNASGIVIVPTGTVLEGPYSVALDGQASDGNAYDVLRSEPGGEEMLKISYPPGSHEISITGARVVPEFPSVAGAMACIAAFSAVVIVASKLLPSGSSSAWLRRP